MDDSDREEKISKEGRSFGFCCSMTEKKGVIQQEAVKADLSVDIYGP